MKKLALTVLLFSSVFAVSHPVLAQKKPAKPAKTATTPARNYVRRDLGIALNKPVGWPRNTKSLLPDMAVCFYKEKESGYQPLIAITSKEIPGGVEIPGDGAVMPPNFEAVIAKVNKEFFPEYAFVASSRFKFKGKDAVSIAFTTRQLQTQILVDVRRVYLVHKGKLLIFELDAEVEDFDLLIPTFDKMMSSVTFLP